MSQCFGVRCRDEAACWRCRRALRIVSRSVDHLPSSFVLLARGSNQRDEYTLRKLLSSALYLLSAYAETKRNLWRELAGNLPGSLFYTLLFTTFYENLISREHKFSTYVLRRINNASDFSCVIKLIENCGVVRSEITSQIDEYNFIA